MGAQLPFAYHRRIRAAVIAGFVRCFAHLLECPAGGIEQMLPSLPWYVSMPVGIAAYLAVRWIEPFAWQLAAFVGVLITLHLTAYSIFRFVFGWRPKESS
jgi:hypothetical protein